MDEKAFSSIDLVCQCMIDEPRTLAFEKAIKAVVNKNSIVLDAGTGSGVMALFAARCGAKKIYAIEHDAYVADIALKNFQHNGFKEQISLLKGDAKNFKYSNGLHFDVVIMEMLTTGMVDEYQIQALNNLHNQGVVSNETIFIPASQETYVSLCDARFKIYNFSMRMVKHLWNNLSQNQKVKLLSKKYLLNSIDFSKINNEDFSTVLNIKAKESGVVNSIYISSVCNLNKNLKIKDTETLNSPVVIPIECDILVKKGDEIKVKINYKFGGGYKDFKVDIIKQ